MTHILPPEPWSNAIYEDYKLQYSRVYIYALKKTLPRFSQFCRPKN